MTPLYKDPSASIEDRIDDLMARMALEEKIAQVTSLWLVLDPEGKHRERTDSYTGGDANADVPSKLRHGLGQITRPLGSRPIDPVLGVRALNKLQRHLVEDTRLGIPVLSHEECLTGLMGRGGTIFPGPLAMAATWNPDLVKKAAHLIGEELRQVGCRQGLSPVLDVARDARWGRTEETFGEDPYLTGVMACAYVDGLQGPDRDVLATLKHFAGHSFSEGGRNHAPVHLGWRSLNDDFLLPFEMAVKLSNAASVMPAYHDIDGEPVHASRKLLTEVLREEWGFDGIIVADYIGVTLLWRQHGVAADKADAAAQAFNAGLDVELPSNECGSNLKIALDRGAIDMETIDNAVRRHLREKFRIGLFERPYADEGKIALGSPTAKSVSRRIATEAVTILDNDGTLPLAEGKTIAVIGPTADDPLALLADYSFPVHLINDDQEDDLSGIVTPLAALRQRYGEKIVYARGCNIYDSRSSGTPVFPGDVDDRTSLDLSSRLSTRRDMMSEAEDTARQADVALVFVGDLSGIFQTGTVGEGSDAADLVLPGVQQELLDRIVATGTPVVVVLSSGRTYNLGGLEDKLAAQVMTFFGGEQGGAAVADVLSGDIEPSGRLILSVPRNVGAMPYFYNHKFKSSGTPIAFQFGSRYPFGHGLSYTSFVYRDLSLNEAEIDIETGVVTARFTIENTGARQGVAVPQLYVRDVLASVVRPVRELKAFGRVELQPGQTCEVTFEVPVDMLNFTGMEGYRVVEPGAFDIMIGPSSGDTPLTGRVEVSGARRRLAKTWQMMSRCSVS